jgi:hypothetical protein
VNSKVLWQPDFVDREAVRAIGSLPFAVPLRPQGLQNCVCSGDFAAIWDSIAVLTTDLAKFFSNTQAAEESAAQGFHRCCRPPKRGGFRASFAPRQTDQNCQESDLGDPKIGI